MSLKITVLQPRNYLRCTIVVAFALHVHLEEPLEPLHELEVVLVPPFDQAVHVDVLLNAQLHETRLENLVVRHVLETLLRTPVHLMHGHLAGIHDVQQHAGDASEGGVFDLGDAQLTGLVDPLHDLLPPHEEGSIHHPYVRHGSGLGRPGSPLPTMRRSCY